MYVEVLDCILEKFSFLTDMFSSKPKLENMLAFLLSISLCPNSTIKGFSEWLGDWKDQSSLNRFLTEGGWKLSEFRQKYSKWLGNTASQEKGTVYFIVDDSKAKKTGEMIEKAMMDFDPDKGRQVLCHTFVVSFVKLACGNFPFQLTLYDKTRKGTAGFKSKLDIAAEQVREFVKFTGVREKLIFLFDSWYCCPKLISALPSWAGWVSRLKRNRLVKVDGFWQKLPEFSGRVKSWDYRKVKVKDGFHVWACSIRIEVKFLGIVTLVLAKPCKYSRKVEFFVSNLDVSAEEILRHYSERWEVEVFFRTAKQNLGLDGYQMRKYKGNLRYWSLVLLTYSILSVLRCCWKRTCKTIGDAIAKLRKLMQKQAQDYGRSYGAMIENYVGEKIAKL